MIDVIDKKHMHDSITTGKEYASNDWTCAISGFILRRFRDLVRVPRISNRVPRIRENYDWVPKIREIGSL